VVGLTTFGSLENNGVLAAGLNFAIPVQILREYLDTARVNPEPSKASQVFADAVQFYETRYYRKALNKLEAVKKLNINYPGLDDLIDSCSKRIKRGEDRGGFLLRNDLIVSSIMLLIITGIYLRNRKGSRHALKH
jgi:hypothetical protein